MRFNLKTAILRAGTSQRRVSVVCGIPENRFSEIVCGWADPRPEERARIAGFLNVPATDTDSLFAVEQLGAAFETRGRR